MEGEDAINLTNFYKICLKCSQFLFTTQVIEFDVYFVCKKCCLFVKWSNNTILQKSQISLIQIEKLMILYMDRKMPSDAESILSYNFINCKLNLKTIIHYFDIFNRIVMEFYLNQLDCVLFEGDVEIDESHLFKENHLMQFIEDML